MNQPSMLNREFWRNRRVLLTGHTGFKGSWLALWLTHMGAQVTGIGQPVESEPHLFTQLNLEQTISQHVIADICDEKNVKKLVDQCQPEVVFHLAAQALVRRGYRNPLQTWNTNVMGSLAVLDALRGLMHPCAVVMVTTDKVYENREWLYGYRENDRLGGHDPYSASKAANELAVASFRDSFCGCGDHQTPYLSIATARAGNVIGGGDWAEDRILPDAIRALSAGVPIAVRNPSATRPWQHVLEALSGYIRLAELLTHSRSNGMQNTYTQAFNFGPELESTRSVRQLIEEVLQHWQGSGEWQEERLGGPHEARQLHLQIDKARNVLQWTPRWSFSTAVERTVKWYQAVNKDPKVATRQCLEDIDSYCGQS